MTKDLEHALVTRFPVLYQDYISPMSQTAMCWGFDHGDGWNDIIWMLSLAIEQELGYSWWQRHAFLWKKDAARRWNGLIYQLSPVVQDKWKWTGDGTKETPYRRIVTEKGRARWPWLKRLIWFPGTGFAVSQVKEKYGGLRFYCPGNKRIARYVRWAEYLAGMTCEVCGEPGEARSDGWIRTLCDTCEGQRAQY